MSLQPRTRFALALAGYFVVLWILWPTPFLALHPDRMVRGVAVLVSSLTLIYMLGWNPGFEGDLWWVGVVNLRNIVLVVLGVITAWFVRNVRGEVSLDAD